MREVETYEDWSARVRSKPLGGGGASGCLLVVITLVVAVLGAVKGLAMFPPGRYPQIALAAPGLLAGGLVYALMGRVIFWLSGRGRGPSSPP